MTSFVRDARADDITAMHAIYGHHAAHGFGTFDEVAPPFDAYEEKWRGIVAAGLPWLVASEAGEIVGFAYASPFRPRVGYRFAVEDSVYVRDDRRGYGVGTALLSDLLERCASGGARQVVAVIGDSLNAASIRLHARAGFEHCGTLRAVGYKLGRWVDVVFMQRALNGGDSIPPPAAASWRSP